MTDVGALFIVRGVRNTAGEPHCDGITLPGDDRPMPTPDRPRVVRGRPGRGGETTAGPQWGTGAARWGNAQKGTPVPSLRDTMTTAVLQRLSNRVLGAGVSELPSHLFCRFACTSVVHGHETLVTKPLPEYQPLVASGVTPLSRQPAMAQLSREPIIKSAQRASMHCWLLWQRWGGSCRG